MINSDVKLLGKVYSRYFVVQKILNDIGYNSKKILGKTIIDTSCGDGSFLLEIVKRIIKYSSKENLYENLQKVYGWDIDPVAINTCKDILNKETEHFFGFKIQWNIHCINSLREIENLDYQYDFIVGNPPYIRIHNLKEEDRGFLKKHYTFCKKGSTDMYIAFFELCIKLLSPYGTCGLITTSSYFYTDNSKTMRDSFVKNKNIKKITNFMGHQMFEDVSTFTAITIFTSEPNESFVYEEMITDEHYETKAFLASNFENKQSWQLTTKDIEENNGVELKDICKIQVGLATLCDKAYIFKMKEVQWDINVGYAQTKLKGEVLIEYSILKPIIKASKFNDGDESKQFILFPYKKVDNKWKIIPEQELKANYPYAYEYLLSIKEELDKRDKGKGNEVAWYAFGRSQGLENSFGKKIIFSPMGDKPKFILSENENATFYSGYCIKYNGDYNILLNELNSERMKEYISISSRSFGSGWKSYSKKVVERFTVNIEK